MTVLSSEQRDHFEKLLNEYEQMREDAQQGMKAVVGDLREKLGALVAKEDLADELAGFRLYVKRRYAKANHPEKVAKADAKSEIADAYEFQASQGQVYTTRTHSAGRANLDLVQTEVVTPRDPSTGEIIEHTNAAASGAPSNRPGTDVAAPESCGTAEGSGAQTESTLAGMAEPSPAAGAAEQGTTVCAESDGKQAVTSQPVVEPGPQDTHAKPSRASTTVAFIPDPSLPRVKNVGHVDDIPAFLKRANSGQVGRA